MEDDVLKISKVEGLKPGELIEINDVLLVGAREFTLVGRPLVKNARVMLLVEQ